MTEENKNLLLKDLCARLPYGVKVHLLLPETMENGYTLKELNTNGNTVGVHLDKGKDSLTFAAVKIENEYGEQSIKPYLRPMSSMTDEEIAYYRYYRICQKDGIYLEDEPRFYDWLNEHHLDWHGLIEKGLALEAPQNMYK